jgi:hypothetical protein
VSLRLLLTYSSTSLPIPLPLYVWCLRGGFRYLLRQLIDSLAEVFDIYIPLLSSKRKYVRQFAAESFAYILRQVPAPKITDSIQKIFATVTKRISGSVGGETVAKLPGRKLELFLHGFSQLLFHSMKARILLHLSHTRVCFLAHSDSTF